jgi:hypothetical protein
MYTDYNKAIAASPVDALPGYVMGGLSWFAIPWLCATTMGLSALALENNPVFPTYPQRMTTQDVNAGLVLPYAAVALLGKGGAAATLLLVFMAVTSASSAELIAVSSIWTYDIYQTYIVSPPHPRFPFLDIVPSVLPSALTIIAEPQSIRKIPNPNVPRFLHSLRNLLSKFLHRSLLRRRQHGLPVPPHGKFSTPSPSPLHPPC